MDAKPQLRKQYPPQPHGRPTKFTRERCLAIIDAISHRIPYELAAQANGICEDTLYEWLKIGRNHMKDGIDSDYARFSEGIKRAEMQKMREHCDIIAARPERWQADAWILERRWHKYFSNSAALIDLNKRFNKLENEENDIVKGD